MSSSNLGLDDPCFKDLLPNERKELFNAISSELTPIDNIFLDSNTHNNTQLVSAKYSAVNVVEQLLRTAEINNELSSLNNQ
jgi:hypothetical protein